MFLAFFELALEFIAVEVFHGALAVILSLCKISSVCAVALLFVGALSVEFAVLPLAVIPVAVFVFYLSLSALDAFEPLSIIDGVCGLFDPLSMTKTLLELSSVDAFSHHSTLAIALIFLSFHGHLHSLTMLIVIFEFTNIDDVFGVSELALTVVFSLEKGSFVDEAVFLVAADKRALSMLDVVHHLSLILLLPALAEDVHHLLCP